MRLNIIKNLLEIKYRLNDTKGIAASLNNIGALYMEMRNADQALVNFKEAYRYARQNDNKQALIYSSINLGTLTIIEKRDDAFTVLKEGEAVAETIDAKIYLKDIYKLLSQLHEQQGNLRLSLSYAQSMLWLRILVFYRKSATG